MSNNLLLRKKLVNDLSNTSADSVSGNLSLDMGVKTDPPTVTGLLIAIAIGISWAVSLVFLLTADLANFSKLELLLAGLLQTFLYTGLFITAHDAMHGAIYPSSAKINHWVGTLALFCYGFFSYDELLKKHWVHHRKPSSESDPDYHDGSHKNFFAWYFHFMKGYWSWRRFGGLAFAFHGSNLLLHIPITNLVLFWVIPSLLSSVQLFYFGTYLPHREPKGGYRNSHRCESNYLPVVLSFLTCYHFGYHEEHHQCPQVPWWQLPVVHKLWLQQQ